MIKVKCHLYQFLLRIPERVPPLACLCVHSAAVQSSVNGRHVVKEFPPLGHLVMISFPHLAYHASHLSLQTFSFLTPLSVKCHIKSSCCMLQNCLTSLCAQNTTLHSNCCIRKNAILTTEIFLRRSVSRGP